MTIGAPGQVGTVLRHVIVPMRDGVRLMANVYLPDGHGPWPVVLVRTAYNRSATGCDVSFVKAGMVVMVQDVRGRYDAEGNHYPFIDEEDDGVDTLEWIGQQPWCNGKVGMYGDSYLAATQFAAGVAQAPHLTALNPRFMAGDCWKRAYYCDGVLSLGLTWAWLCFEQAQRTSDAATMPRLDVAGILRTLPICDLDKAGGAGQVQFYQDYVRNNQYGEFWKRISIRHRYDRFTMPVLLTGGWYDNYAAETVVEF